MKCVKKVVSAKKMSMTMKLMIGEFYYNNWSDTSNPIKIITKPLILSLFLNVFRKVACEELSLECNFTMGRASSNNIDIASSDLSFDNLGTKNSMSKEKDQTACHRHTASSLRGCAKKGWVEFFA